MLTCRRRLQRAAKTAAAPAIKQWCYIVPDYFEVVGQELAALSCGWERRVSRGRYFGRAGPSVSRPWRSGTSLFREFEISIPCGSTVKTTTRETKHWMLHC